MVTLTRRFLALLLVPVVAALLATLAPAAPAHAASTYSINGVKLNASEAGLVNYINAARKKAGLRPLWVAPGTTDVARRWARSMAGARVMKHNPNFAAQVAKSGSPKWTKISENVGYASACNVKQLFDAYMKSPGHRANIMDRKMRVIGIGSVDRTDRQWGCGILYNTMNFVDSYDSKLYGRNRVAPWNLINY
jgi:uncharacterized protein YkwD